ncbi:MAG: nucleotidyltransferase family protein, partial [Dongia sp.]
MSFPKTAMVMAAGYGKRLRPLTDTVPKPMVKVLGRPMIDVVLNRLAAAGVERVVINLHHLGEVIRDHLKSRKDLEILYSEEPEILETGGGTKKALPLLGPDPFFVVNAKIIWLNGREDALQRLAHAWDESRMDSLLLLQPTV